MFIAIFVLVGIAIVISRNTASARALRKIPGPRGYPIVGNTFQLGNFPQQVLTKWARQYGEIMRVQIGYYDWIYLNTPEAVKEILDKQSVNTSGRIPMPVASELISGGYRFLFMGYTPTWRQLRANVHKLLTPKASAMFKPSQELEAKQLVHELLTKNIDESQWYLHIRRYSTSVVMTSTYGRRIPEWDCEEVREIYMLLKEFSEATTPGAFLADLIPPLADIIPVWLQTWRKTALKYQARQTAIWMKFWRELRTQIDDGTAPECFVKGFIEQDFERQNISEVQAAYVAGSKCVL